MKLEEIMLYVIYGMLLFIYVVICLLLEYKGKVVDGIIKESIFIPEKTVPERYCMTKTAEQNPSLTGHMTGKTG